MDIILHCLDPGHLKTKGLQDVFPAVCRFNQVSHCPATRRIAGNKYFLSNSVIGKMESNGISEFLDSKVYFFG